MWLTSPEYQDGGVMPADSATRRAGGRNRSPAYDWGDAPEGTRSFALAVIDRSARDWVHWEVVGIPATATGIASGASPSRIPESARELWNTFGDRGWGGPQPPPGSGPHDYEATLYALDAERVRFPEVADARAFAQALDGHVIAQVSLSATLER